MPKQKKVRGHGLRLISHGSQKPSNSSKLFCQAHRKYIHESIWHLHQDCMTRKIVRKALRNAKEASSETKKVGGLGFCENHKINVTQGDRKHRHCRIVSLHSDKALIQDRPSSGPSYYYCSIHGKFVGRAWSGHRRLCRASETSLANWNASHEKAKWGHAARGGTIKDGEIVKEPSSNGLLPIETVVAQLNDRVHSLHERKQVVIRARKELKETFEKRDAELQNELWKIENDQRDFLKRLSDIVNSEVKIK